MANQTDPNAPEEEDHEETIDCSISSTSDAAQMTNEAVKATRFVGK